MKALVLTWFRTFTDRIGDEYFVCRDHCISPHIADIYVSMKRLTKPELAAEYWRAATIDTTYWGADDEGSPDGARAIEQTIILKRFATLPHYDEATK